MKRAKLRSSRLRRRRIAAWSAFVLAQAVLIVTLFGFVSGMVADGVNAQSSVRPPENATTNLAPQAPGKAARDAARKAATGRVGDGSVPGNSAGIRSDADLWRFVRGDKVPDISATTSLPNKQSAVLVQSFGDDWRSLRSGPLAQYGGYALGAMLALLALFFLLRGRVRIDAGPSGKTMQRFNGLERFAHWLLATSFIILAVTGLTILYGREVLLPVLGPDAFATIAQAGKWLHNNVGWAFMVALAMVFLLWVVHNIPGPRDIMWLLKGGGVLVKGVHPDSKKFNAGQKIIFWAVILLGLSISLSGIALLFPFQTAMMAKTFAVLNTFGFDLPTNLTPMEEMQYQTIWHSIAALALIVIILAHIYIGSIGMEGAFDAMGSGDVDTNWAREHHNLWAAEQLGEPVHRHTAGHGDATKVSQGSPAPAE